MTHSKNTDRPFTSEEIQDVRIIIKANGKSYGIIERPSDGVTKDMIKGLRVLALKSIIDFHDIVTPSLEEIGFKTVSEYLVGELEDTLKPEFMNDVFTWTQIKDATEKLTAKL